MDCIYYRLNVQNYLETLDRITLWLKIKNYIYLGFFPDKVCSLQTITKVNIMPILLKKLTMLIFKKHVIAQYCVHIFFGKTITKLEKNIFFKAIKNTLLIFKLKNKNFLQLFFSQWPKLQTSNRRNWGSFRPPNGTRVDCPVEVIKPRRKTANPA